MTLVIEGSDIQPDLPVLRTNEELPFPEVLDNTIISTYAHCQRQSYWNYFQDLHEKRKSIHLHAGGAFADAAEKFRMSYYYGEHKGDYTKALHAGFIALTKFYGYDPERDMDEKTIDSNKSFEGMANAYFSYWAHWHPATDRVQPLVGVDGKPSVETSFALPLDVCHPVTGDPILLHGRYDLLGTLGGSIYVVDEKTTKQLGPSWGKQWDMRSQFTGYCLGAMGHDRHVAGAIIRGTAILKTKITHAEVIVYRPQIMLDNWYNDINYLVEQMIESWKAGRWLTTGSFSGACGSYSGCPYKNLCMTDNVEGFLSNYSQYKWDPTNPSDED
jgi:hypothetical protein